MKAERRQTKDGMALSILMRHAAKRLATGRQSRWHACIKDVDLARSTITVCSSTPLASRATWTGFSFSGEGNAGKTRSSRRGLGRPQ
jgi:hypothetical protein